MYSSPPIHGALIVATILGDAELTALWFSECKKMADRIGAMRILLKEKLEAASGVSWKHITDQIGMFCYTGLSVAQVCHGILYFQQINPCYQVLRLRNEFHIYCTDDGRFSIAGFNHSNLDYVAQSVAAVL